MSALWDVWLGVVFPACVELQVLKHHEFLP